MKKRFKPLVVKGVIYGILAAFCFGVMPILTKLIYGSTGVDPFFFLMIRYSSAAVILWTYLSVRRKYPWRGVTRRTGGWVFASACSYFIVTAAYFVALKYINASLNTLLCFTFPVFTPFLGYLFQREKLSRVTITAAIVGFLGCALVIGGYQLKGSPGETLGLGLGLLSGLLYAVYSLLGQKTTARLEPIQVTALNISIVALFFIVARLPWLWTHPEPVRVYVVAVVIGLVSTILANYFYFESIRAVGAVKAGIFSSFEPVFTTVLAILFLGERMGIIQIFGALFILGGMVIAQQPWMKKTDDAVIEKGM